MIIEKLLNSMYVLFADSILGSPNDLGLPTTQATGDKLQTILIFIFGLIAAISFLMIVFAGFKYVISIGDPQKIVAARKTIVYSIVGLVVSLSATAIVAFVINTV